MAAADIHLQQFVQVLLQRAVVVAQLVDTLGKILALGLDIVLGLGMVAGMQLLLFVGTLLQLVDSLLQVVDRNLQFVGKQLPVVVAVVGRLPVVVDSQGIHL